MHSCGGCPSFHKDGLFHLVILFSMHNTRFATVRKDIFLKAHRRTQRVSKLQRTASRKQKHQLYNVAVRPVAMYGGSYWGFPDSAVKPLERRWPWSMAVLRDSAPHRYHAYCGQVGLLVQHTTPTQCPS